MTDTERTLTAIDARAWTVVRLGHRLKRPVDKHWVITRDADEVGRWFAAGRNVGLLCCEQTGVAVLDADRFDVWADMVDALGQPCLPWVLTGSAKLHYYVQWADDLPAKLTWDNVEVGEIQRGPGQQQVVLPPSVHPETGEPYRWITDDLPFLVEPINPVADPLPTLPDAWRKQLQTRPYATNRS
jgi:Bifunctional DNA primase/polymerase, N-terminal